MKAQKPSKNNNNKRMRNDLNSRKEEEREYGGRRSRSRSREAQHDEMTNKLLNRIIDLEVRVKYLEEENKKQKNQNKQNNISFGQFISIGASGKANEAGFIMVVSHSNGKASITIDGNNVQILDQRDKDGQGRVSCCSPINKGSIWYCQGEKILFIPLKVL